MNDENKSGHSPAPSAKQEPVAIYSGVEFSRYTIEWTNGPVPVGTKFFAAPSASASPAAPTEAEIRAEARAKALEEAAQWLDSYDGIGLRRAEAIRSLDACIDHTRKWIAANRVAALPAKADLPALGLYQAVNAMMAHLGAHGEISARHDLAGAVMRELHNIDGGAAPVAGSQQVPEGWAVKKEGSAISISHPSIGFAVTHRDARDPADVVLYHLAEQWLAAAAPAVPVPVEQDHARDAARYRWLRDSPWSFTRPELAQIIQLQQNALWDAEIDAAMAAAPSLQQGKEGASDAQ